MSSENKNGVREGGTSQLPVAAGSNLTIPSGRLAGSDDCLNCGTALMGPFCYYCGQPDKNLVRFFPALMRELLEDFMDFDSRFIRTIKPLLFKPGRLTRDYLDGKRFRYVPPLRLYIFSSIAFFFLAAFLATDAINITTDAGGENSDEISANIRIGETEKEELRDALQGLEDIDPALAEEVTREAEKFLEESGQAESLAGDSDPATENEEHDESDGIPEKPEFDLNGKPWDRETNPLVIPFMPDSVNARINEEIEQSPQKGKAIAENPNLIWDKVFEVMPATMFVLLPIVALLLKFWYLFAKKYYVEHLVFALHNHAFIFVVLLIAMLMNALVGWQEPSGEGPWNTALLWTTIVMYSWIPLYLLLSLKRVYQQGWSMTLAKYSVIGISYLVLLIFATVIVAVISFVLL